MSKEDKLIQTINVSTNSVDEKYEFANDSNRVVDEKDQITTFSFLRKISDKLDSFGVETNGIERVSPHARSRNRIKQFLSVIGLWMAGCGGLTTMSSFYLGSLLFGLGLRNALITGLLGQFVGCAVASYCSLMGPRSGCRQIITARFLFGWWMVKFVGLINIIGLVGWASVNCIVGGQILSKVSEDHIPLVVSIVIMVILSLAIAIVGVRFFLKAESFLSIPIIGSSLMLYIVSASKYKYLTWEDSVSVNSPTLYGNAFSFLTLCYSITSTWGSCASDYYILFPQDTPDIQVFFVTLIGTLVPTTAVGVAAILVGNIAVTYKPWADAFDSSSLGGLLGAVFEPWGAGGKFIMVLMFLSLIANNAIGTYSTVFSVQIIALPLARVPRWFWSFIQSVACLVLAIAGRGKFVTILGNLLPMIGYWVSIYFFLLLEENAIFRTRFFRHLYTKEFEEIESDDESLAGGNTNYNFSIWNTQTKLTHGIAATVAFVCGAAGAAVGMAQTYWIGPLAKKVGGDYGGDIGMWLSMAFSGVVYPLLRYWELRKFGR
ncbi:hypothetical protein JCM33374_g5137 [Metschnikowia sp. JCM 33374]|nr:hypothetical protein JCM33374_g5137 [Metschnikowia sp. JCM 33374]